VRTYIDRVPLIRCDSVALFHYYLQLRENLLDQWAGSNSVSEERCWELTALAIQLGLGIPRICSTSVPHSAFICTQAFISSIFSAPLNSFLDFTACKNEKTRMDVDKLMVLIAREQKLSDALVEAKGDLVTAKGDLVTAKDELLNRERELKDELLNRERELKDDLTDERIRSLKLEHELKSAIAALMRSRGSLEPRAAIDFCEDYKLPAMKIKGNTRRLIWTSVWGHPDFKKHHKLALVAPSIMNAVDQGDQFGKIVTSIYTSQSNGIHNLSGNSIVIPQKFNSDQRAVMDAICEFIPIGGEHE